jgi:predicted transposase YdaD
LDQVLQQAQLEVQRAELVIQSAVPRLLALGLTVEQVASSLELSVEQVEAMI